MVGTLNSGYQLIEMCIFALRDFQKKTGQKPVFMKV